MIINKKVSLKMHENLITFDLQIKFYKNDT